MQPTVIERAQTDPEAYAASTLNTPPLVNYLNKFLKHPTFGQPFRFGLVSACTTLVDYAVLITLNYFLPHVKIFEALAFASGYCAGTIVHFFAARRFVFKPTHHPVGLEFFLVFLVGLVGLLLTAGIGVTLLHMGFNLYVAKAITIVIVFCWNFFARRYLIYHHR